MNPTTTNPNIEAFNAMTKKQGAGVIIPTSGGVPTQYTPPVNPSATTNPPVDTTISTKAAPTVYEKARQGKDSYTRIDKSSGNQTLVSPNSPAANSTDPYVRDTQAVDTSFQNATNKILGTLEGIRNGSVPLSPYEQAQLDATKKQFEDVIHQQEIANQNFIGGTTVAQEARGLSRYSPEMAKANIFAVTTEANNKIASLDSKMSLALADMESGFRDKKYSQVKDAYNILVDAKKQKTEAIDKMYSKLEEEKKKVQEHNQQQTLASVSKIYLDPKLSTDEKSAQIGQLVSSGVLTTQQLKDVNETLRTIKQDEITNKLNSDKFTWQQKQDLVKNAIEWGNLSVSQGRLALDKVAKAPATGDYAPIINGAASLVGANKAPAIKDALNQAINNKDYTTAYATIANAVEDSLTGTNKTKFADSRTDIGVMEGMRDAIQAYSAAGGDMGYLKGTADQISKKFGQLTVDPKFAALGVQLQREFQSYRLNMTGAAFSPAESKEYENVNPRTNATLDLNLATIDGALAQLKNRVNSTIEERVPSASEIYDLANKKSEIDPLNLNLEDNSSGQTKIDPNNNPLKI